MALDRLSIITLRHLDFADVLVGTVSRAAIDTDATTAFPVGLSNSGGSLEEVKETSVGVRLPLSLSHLMVALC